MRLPHDNLGHRDTASDSRPPQGRAPAPALDDTTGWQALYQAMLGHITGNVEVWLKTYLGDLMRSGVAAADAGRGGAGGSAGSGGAMKFAIPPWLEPFQDPDNVRFTRTPDHILLRERGVPFEAEVDEAPADPDTAGEAAVERRPFVLPPGVRNTRTPDRLLTKSAATAPADPVSPATDEEVASVPPEADETPAEASVLAEAAPPAATEEPASAGGEPAARIETLAILPSLGAAGREPNLAELLDDLTWSDVPPQPWGDIIQLGPLETLDVVAEQNNQRDGIRPPADRDEQVVPDPVTVALEVPPESEGIADAVVLDAPDQVAAPAVPEGELTLVTEVAAPVGTAEEAAVPLEVGEPEPEPAAVAAAVAEPARPPIAPEDALHMALLGGLSSAPVRRRFSGSYEHPSLDLLMEPARPTGTTLTRDSLEQHARLLEGVLEDFGIRGEIINVRPGPVVTLYELEPAPGMKSSRVVGLADDIARSMSAVSARVAVVQGRNAIGIELPNERRDMVFLRELFAQPDFDESKHKLAIALGKTIGGEPVIVDLARMPHLLVAGTTGSGKSVAINTMILSLLYRMKPEECRLIMVDPKMLELSIYDGIPHLLTPVVTDPKKAVIALKWAVREMEDRYKKMSKVGVRNIDGFNVRVAEAKAKGEVIVRTVHTGFDRQTGQATYAQEAMDLTVLPYIVVIVDEMADLMMVAGKDIEGAIQRLAQMARAAGIHLIMATQRPSVDVITGTIKANFPTRISFQVTSKIDSRTILGEQGAEQLLGQGDMLYMAGGGRIARVHGPFVSDGEVELVVNHLKAQGQPDYLDVTTEDGEGPAEASATGAGGEEVAEDSAVFDRTGMGVGAGIEDGDLYDNAVKIVLRDKKCSTSYVQRRLAVGYNKAASLVEKMEKEGIVGPANHAGKREILMSARDLRTINITMPTEEDDDA